MALASPRTRFQIVNMSKILKLVRATLENLWADITILKTNLARTAADAVFETGCDKDQIASPASSKVTLVVKRSCSSQQMAIEWIQLRRRNLAVRHLAKQMQHSLANKEALRLATVPQLAIYTPFERFPTHDAKNSNRFRLLQTRQFTVSAL